MSGSGYHLGGGRPSSSALSEREKKYAADVEAFKKKEWERHLQKLDEKVKRYSHLRTDIGYKLVDREENTPDRTIGQARIRQQEMYEKFDVEERETAKAVECQKARERYLKKLDEKVKRHSYLRTDVGNKLVDGEENTPDSTIGVARIKQQQMYEKFDAQEREAAQAVEFQKEKDRYLRKLDEKVKRHSYLRTDIGNKLVDGEENTCDSTIGAARIKQQLMYERCDAQESEAAKAAEFQKEKDEQERKLKDKIKKFSYLNISAGEQVESAEDKIDHDQMLKEARRRQQENYLKKSSA